MKNAIIVLIVLFLLASAFLTGGLFKLAIVGFYMFLGWSLANMK